MNLPDWSELTENQRSMLKSIASSFGINVNNEKVDDMVLPNETEAFSIALEMFTLSRTILQKSIKETA
jgi:hypothetical protein